MVWRRISALCENLQHTVFQWMAGSRTAICPGSTRLVRCSSSFWCTGRRHAMNHASPGCGAPECGVPSRKQGVVLIAEKRCGKDVSMCARTAWRQAGGVWQRSMNGAVWFLTFLMLAGPAWERRWCISVASRGPVDRLQPPACWRIPPSCDRWTGWCIFWYLACRLTYVFSWRFLLSHVVWPAMGKQVHTVCRQATVRETHHHASYPAVSSLSSTILI